MREVQRGEFDVIHAHAAGALALTRWVEEPPLVYTIHHVRTECLSAFYSYFPGAAYVAISADQSRRELPLPDVTVIHHGLAPTRYEWSRTAGDYVAFVGRFAEVKGVHTAIDVAAAAGIPIKVAGSVHPPDAEYGAREVLPRLAMPHVEHLGGIGMDGKVALLRDARALLVPINWNEPFGLIIAEAMLSGCPVVAFPRGSVPELVEHGLTGFIVNTEREMAGLIREGGPLESFDRRQCRARAVERFGRDRMVAEYEALYERHIAPRRHGLQIA
jgi:glycosyltransferase involved in cell wall biosynthesis